MGASAKSHASGKIKNQLTGDARPRFFESWTKTLCSRSRCGAREALTVGYQPTKNHRHSFRILILRTDRIRALAKSLASAQSRDLTFLPLTPKP